MGSNFVNLFNIIWIKKNTFFCKYLFIFVLRMVKLVDSIRPKKGKSISLSLNFESNKQTQYE